MTEPVSDQISALQDCDTAVLRRRWRALMGRALPAHLPRSLILRLLAYRIQADAFGDLDANTARVLDRIASQQKDQPREGKPTLESLGLSSRGERTLSPGTVLVREHNGVNHHGMALEEGFAWNGRRFFGLSSPKCTVKTV